MLGNSFNTKDANLKKFNCLSLNGCNAISEVNIDLEMCEVFYKIKEKELPFQYVNYAVCVASARFRWSYCIGRKLRQEQFLEKLAWKGLLTAKIICEMGTTNNWLASVAFVERDWERSKTEKRLGREGTFSSAFRAFLSLPSPPLPSPPLFLRQSGYKNTEDHLLRGARFADWAKTITQLSPVNFDTTYICIFIYLFEISWNVYFLACKTKG